MLSERARRNKLDRSRHHHHQPGDLLDHMVRHNGEIALRAVQGLWQKSYRGDLGSACADRSGHCLYVLQQAAENLLLETTVGRVFFNMIAASSIAASLMR